MTLSLPPFTRAVTWLLGINTAIFLLMELLPLLRLDIQREIQALKAGQRHFQEMQQAQADQFHAALRALEALHDRLAPISDEAGFGLAETRVDLQKQIWCLERRTRQLHSKSATSGK